MKQTILKLINIYNTVFYICVILDLFARKVISHRISLLCHFGIQLVCKLTEGHTLNLKAAVVQILLDI